MIELLKIYSWTIPAGAVFAAGLGLLGCHLAARDRAMQTVCVSQGAMLGVILALGISQMTHIGDNESVHLLPFLISLLTGAITFLGTDRLASKMTLSKNTLFAAVFALLLASGYFASAVFPALESHMTQVYFGDLATLTEFDSKLTLAMGALAVGVFWFAWKPISNQSFEIGVYGEHASARSGKLWAIAFNIVALSMLCYAVQFLGFLFTITALFVPTTILTSLRSKGLRRHLTLSALLATAGSVTGFLISLKETRFPTVPSIALTIAVLGLGVSALDRIGGARWRPKRGSA